MRMSGIKLDGKLVKKELEEQIAERSLAFYQNRGRKPKLATIMVGDNPASEMYIRMKKKACERVFIDNDIYHLEGATTFEVMNLIERLNIDSNVDGILIQHPLPNEIDEVACFNLIKKEKDVDGVGAISFGYMTEKLPSYAPATAKAIMTILDFYQIPIEGKHAVVVGRSQILGKPVGMLLLNENATVTICHSKSKNLEQHLANADIVVAAVGKPNFIKPSSLKDGVVVIDAGYNKGNIGDVDNNGLIEKASFYTPVPGGVGPVTIATLLEQTMDAAEKNYQKKYKK